MISPTVPNRLGVVNYNGAPNQHLLLSAQYSQKDWATEGVGGTSTKIIDSPFLTRTGTQYQYNAPYFDATDPEQRNNRQLTASMMYFASSRGFGSHELKSGFENFVDQRVGANAQSSTGYVFLADFVVAGGAPVLDADGHPIAMFVPNTSRVQRWIPHRVLNNQTLIAWDTTITADPASARDEFGLPTGYLEGPRFGQGTSNLHYPTPRAGLDGGRMFDFAVGFRF